MKYTDPEVKPTTAFNPASDAQLAQGIPAELRDIPQWIAWRFVWDEKRAKGAWAKQPTDPRTGRTFDCHKPTNWSTFETALQGARRFGCDGIGFVFTENDPYCGIDLDGVIEDDGISQLQIAPLAEEVLRHVPTTYTERSVSNTGVHLIVKCEWGKGNNNQALGIEVYDRGRYFAFSGFNHYGPDGTGEIIALPETAVDYLRNFFIKEKPAKTKNQSSDQELFASPPVPELESEFPIGIGDFAGMPVASGQPFAPPFEPPMPLPVPAPTAPQTPALQSAASLAVEELLSPSRIIPANPKVAKPITTAQAPVGAISIYCAHCNETWVYPPYSVQPKQQVVCSGCARFLTYKPQPLQTQHVEMPQPEAPLPPAPLPTTLNLTTGDEEIDFYLNWYATSANADKFIQLFVHGDISEYRNPKTGDPDHSVADMALLGLLSFHCQNNADRLERLFSMSALGQRDKWRERADYRANSIDKVFAMERDYYAGPDVWEIYKTIRDNQPSGITVPYDPTRDMRVAVESIHKVVQPTLNNNNGHHPAEEQPKLGASLLLTPPDFPVDLDAPKKTVTATDLALAAQAVALEEHWQDVVELPKYDVTELNYDALPASLKDFTEYTTQVADYTQTSALASFMMGLAGVSMIVGERCQVQANWREVLNLYLLLVLPPGSRKSAIYDEYYKVIEAIEQRIRKETDADLLVELGERERIQQEVKDAQRKLAVFNGSKRGSAMQATPKSAIVTEQNSEGVIESSTINFEPERVKDWLKAQYEEMAAWRPLAHFSRIVDDVTPEKLAGMLVRQGGFMCVASAEGGTFFKHMTGLYGRAANNDVFLKGHAGDSLKVARSSEDVRQGIQDAHVILPEARLSITLAIQPGILSESVQRSSGELAQSGMMGRFAYVFPQSNIGYREADFTKLPQPDDWARGMYERGLNVLFNNRHNVGWLPDTLVFSPQAYANFVMICQQIEADQKPGGLLYELTDWGWASKLPGLIMRLAGLIQIAKHVMVRRGPNEMIPPVKPEIDEESLTTAYMLGNVLISHALKAFGRVQKKVQDLDRTQYVLNKLRELHEKGRLDVFSNKTESISLRNLMRACRQVPDANELKLTLNALTERGYVKMLQGQGGRQIVVVNKTVWLETD